MNILVIDIGTTSTKGIIYDEMLLKKYEYRVPSSPEYLDAVHVEENPAVWEKAVVEIGSYMANQTEVDAVVLTSQRSSVFAIDRIGNPLTSAIMWQDRRTEEICRRCLPEEKNIYEKTGLLVKPVYGAPKMTWIRESMPDIYKKTYKFVTIADYVIHLLTENWITDSTYGNRSLLMNLHTKTWDMELLDIFGVEKDKLMELTEPGSLCGNITKEFSLRTGLKSGIPVYTAGGDQQSSALGLGVMEQRTGEITHGTGSYLLLHAEKPILDYKKKISCNVSAIPGKYIAEMAIMTTGAVYEWFRNQFYQEKEKKYFDCINEEVKESGPFSGGVYMIPNFQGSSFPNWNVKAKGMFCNLALHTTRGDMARAVLEGIAAQLSRGIEEMEKIYGNLESIALSGGLCAIDVFNQLQADIYEKKVTVYQNAEATSIGAWISASVSMGLFLDYQSAFLAAEEKNEQKLYVPDPLVAPHYRKWKECGQRLEKVLEDTGIDTMFYDMERGWK